MKVEVNVWTKGYCAVCRYYKKHADPICPSCKDVGYGLTKNGRIRRNKKTAKASLVAAR